jgi:hypothetical protein
MAGGAEPFVAPRVPPSMLQLAVEIEVASTAEDRRPLLVKAPTEVGWIST